MVHVVWYGIILCASTYYLNAWRTVGDDLLNKRSKQQSYLFLILAVIVYILCTLCSWRWRWAEQFFKMAWLFVLPVAPIWDFFDHQNDSYFNVLLGMHFAMTFADSLDDFWVSGWQFCFLALIFDCLLLYRIRVGALLSQHSTQAKFSFELIRRLVDAECVCDGYCLLDGCGNILFSDPKLLILLDRRFSLGTNSQSELCGKPFSSLMPGDCTMDSGGPAFEIGERFFTLCAARGRDVVVEALTVRCLLDHDSIDAIFGPGLENPRSPEVYLRTLRKIKSVSKNDKVSFRSVNKNDKTGLSSTSTTLSDLEPAKNPTKLPFHSLADFSKTGSLPNFLHLDQVSGTVDRESDVGRGNPLHRLVGTPCGSDVGRRSALSDARKRGGSIHGSQVGMRSSVSSIHGSRVGRKSSMSLSEVGWNPSVVGEMDNCSCVSSNTGVADNFLEKTRLKLMENRLSTIVLEVDLPMSDAGGSSIASESMRVPTPFRARMRLPRAAGTPNNGCRRFESHGSGDMGHCSSMDEDVEEEMVTTEVLNTTAGEDGRMCLQFGFKSQLLSEQQHEVDALRRDLSVMDEVQQDQKAVLQDFKRVVSRQFSQICEEGPPNISVSILEESSAARTKLKRDCRMLGYPCQVFESLDEYSVLLNEDADCCLTETGRLRRPKWQSQVSDNALAWAPLGPPAQIVILGSSLIDQLPTGWLPTGVFVVLLCSPDENSEEDCFDVLPGVNRILHGPISLERWRCLVQEALQWRFNNDYLLVKFSFGAGATSKVHIVKRFRDGESFALKEATLTGQMGRSKAGNKKKIRSLCREAEILRKMRWPTLLFMTDAWWADEGKRLYMLLHPMRGGSMEQKVAAATEQKCSIKSNLVADWYVQALHGLSYLHWCGLIHRDLKPANFMLDVGDRALRIGDFGSIAYAPHTDSHPRRRSYVKESVTAPAFAAPEVLTKELFYSPSDIWSLGATFYEVLLLQPLISPSPCTSLLDALDHFEAAVQTVDVSCLQDRLQQAASDVEDEDEISTESLAKLLDEVSQMLQQDHLKRPTAAALIGQVHWNHRLLDVLSECGLLSDLAARERHQEFLQQIIEESEAATWLEAPEFLARTPMRRPSLTSEASRKLSRRHSGPASQVASKASGAPSFATSKASIQTVSKASKQSKVSIASSMARLRTGDP